MIVIVEIIYPAFLRWAVQYRHRLSLCTEPPQRTWHPSEDTSKVIVPYHTVAQQASGLAPLYHYANCLQAATGGCRSPLSPRNKNTVFSLHRVLSVSGSCFRA